MGLVLEDLKARGLRQAELIVTDGAGGLEKALEGRFADIPVQRCIMHAARNVMAKVRAEQGRGGSRPTRDLGLPRSALPRGEDRQIPDLLRLPRGGLVEDQTNNVAERAFRFVRERQRPMGAFTNEESAERIFGTLGGKWNRKRSHPIKAIYTT